MQYLILFIAVLGTPVLSSINSCRKWREWECHDGTCIPLESKCDGQIDCMDKSDESHAVCRNTQCQGNLFRCTYGACVDGTAPCNGIQECADNSDELLPRCRNETTLLKGRYFECRNGEMILGDGRCDGVVNCKDKSDEMLATCAGTVCPEYYFQCKYGACVDNGSDCDGKNDCADGSDEDDVLCNKTLPIKNKGLVNTEKGCVLPQYPEHGSYAGIGVSTSPGDSFHDVKINFTCANGYRISGESLATCRDGKWQSEFPECIANTGVCKLNRKEGVKEYICYLKGVTGDHDCKDYEPAGTKVKHSCKFNYRPENTASGYMHCKEDGTWGDEARCVPVCGTVIPHGGAMVINGKTAERGELPWHTGIYRKENITDNNVLHYKQICGGSLISRTMVISAAHCFWENDQLQPAHNYAVALGKLYISWQTYEDDAQKSDVKKLYVPSEYMHDKQLYMQDIAMVELATAIEYQPHIRPVCMDFDINRDAIQLSSGSKGKVAGWGYMTTTSIYGSKKLRVVDLPYVERGVCIKNSKSDFGEFITPDKFCAGYQNGTALCEGDSGGGLVFRDKDERYYLRGIVSTAQKDQLITCDANSYSTFTKIQMYEHFIKDHLRSDE